MNSKTVALLFLGIIFLLAGFLNVILEHAPALNPLHPSYDTISGLFGKLTGMFTYLSKPSTSYIEANLTVAPGSIQEFNIKSCTSMVILLGNNPGNLQVSQLFGNPLQIELDPYSMLTLAAYTGSMSFSNGVELEGKVGEIKSSATLLRSEKSPLRLEAYIPAFTSMQMINISISGVTLLNVRGVVRLSWERESIIHRIGESRVLKLDGFQGDIIVNGSNIILRGKATYRPNLLIMPGV